MPEQTICEGDSAFVHVPQINGIGQPLNIINYSWSPATNIDNPSGGPDVAIFPTDSIWYYVTLTSVDSVWTDSVKINVVHVPTPNAGLDDSICHSTTAGYQFSPSLSNPGNNVLWEYYLGPSTSPGTPNSIFQPNASNLNATALTNWPGLYQYILHEIDTSGYCPDGTDTVAIFFSKETHTTTVTQPTCFDSNDGAIQVTSTGMLGAVLYGFNGVAVNSQADTSGLAPGIYTVVSQDIVGCTFTQTDTIIAPPPVLLTAGPSNPDTTVCENAVATVYANAINGITFEYHWDFTTDLGPVQQLSPINDTTVTVYSVNETGCHSDTLSITIQMYQPITIDYLVNDTICPGYDANMFINATGGYQGYNYEWTENGQLMSDNTPLINVNPMIETTYCVTVSDNCQSTPKTTCGDVIMREVPEPAFSSNVIEACVPAEVTFFDVTTYNFAETQTDSVNWFIEGELYQSDSVFHLFETPGLYDVTYEVYTQFGCHNSIEILEYMTIHGLPQPNFFINPNPTTIFVTEVDMVNLTPDDSTNMYQWYFPGGSPANSNLNEPTVLYPEGIADDYAVQLIVTNQYGCMDSLNDVLHVISDVLIYAPNAFTPDNDQRNNTWRVYMNGIDVEDFHLLIFNRWGEVVWESYDSEGVWKGNYINGTIQDGTYVWRIITKDYNTDKKYEFKGTVTVLK
jgi:gliding motility-associated-like protein